MAERTDWTADEDASFLAGDGSVIRRHDDVSLIEAAPVKWQGIGGPWKEAPAGSLATVLFFTTAEPIETHLECYVDDGFCLVETPAKNLRLAMRYEEKWPELYPKNARP